jgi:choline dehydrogenase
MAATSDVLIIGAGSAGLFCALGLAGSASVTLVEAGPDAGTPPPHWMLYDYLLPDECYYQYADADTGMALPQGRGTGGGSTVNSAAALRGQPWCFDGWDIPGWSWADCLDGFRAIESDQQFGDADYHGSAGPIPITRLTPGPLDEAFIGLCAGRGFPAAEDHNAPGALGIGVWPTNRRGEGRWGTHAAVLPLIRSVVDLRVGTQVERLVFEGTRCVGADVRGPGGEERLRAGHVVLCAGAFGSPLLLLRSGIGPEADLRQAGIDVVAPLDGVGANLQDHPWCLLDVLAADVADIEARPVSGALLRYELPGEPGGEHVEAEIFPWQTKPYVPAVPAAQVSYTAALMRPLSRGRLTLAPDGPVIHARHLTNSRDAARMAEIVTTTAQLVDELAAAGLVRVPDGAWWRAGDLVAGDLVAECRRVVGTYNHHCGTCRMGDSADPGTVVDAALSVVGTTGLSVADSSILPVIPRANTNLTAMMIGHRAAQFLRTTDRAPARSE